MNWTATSANGDRGMPVVLKPGYTITLSDDDLYHIADKNSRVLFLSDWIHIKPIIKNRRDVPKSIRWVGRFLHFSLSNHSWYSPGDVYKFLSALLIVIGLPGLLICIPLHGLHEKNGKDIP